MALANYLGYRRTSDETSEFPGMISRMGDTEQRGSWTGEERRDAAATLGPNNGDGE